MKKCHYFVTMENGQGDTMRPGRFLFSPPTARGKNLFKEKGTVVMDIRVANCKVVEYQSGSLPITLEALPEDVAQGEKMAKFLILAMSKFRSSGKVALQTATLGRVEFWETRTRSRRGGPVKHTYHMRHEELKLEFGSPAYHDLRRWVAIATQLLGSGYPWMIASSDGKGIEFGALNGQALDAD